MCSDTCFPICTMHNIQLDIWEPAPDGLRLCPCGARVGETRQRYFAGTNLKPETCPQTRRLPSVGGTPEAAISISLAPHCISIKYREVADRSYQGSAKFRYRDADHVQARGRSPKHETPDKPDHPLFHPGKFWRCQQGSSGKDGIR